MTPKELVQDQRQVNAFETNNEESHKNKTVICLAYDKDFEALYAFWCARYENISIEKFLNIGLTEFNAKISSIPESEPLFTVIRSRTVKLSKIKSKEERKYWAELKRANKIPQLYLSNEELDGILKREVNDNGFGKIL